MSKYLVKILSICAFVIIIPLAILATALCVTGSASYKVRLYIVGQDAEASTANCKVLVNGKESKNNVFSFAKGEEAILTFESEGYDFVGWYNGTDKTYNGEEAPVTANVTYSIKVTGNVSMTAKCAIKTYEVTYKGFQKDKVTPFDYGTITYKYGKELVKINDESFRGWRVEGTDDYYTNATFPISGKVDVVGNWIDEKKVVYFDGEKELYSNYYSKDALSVLTLLDENSPIVKAAITDENGGIAYRFLGWTDAEGTMVADLTGYVANFDASTPVNLYIKKEKILYKNVSFNDGDVAIKAITFEDKKFAEKFALLSESETEVSNALKDADGYVAYAFQGWATDKEGLNLVTEEMVKEWKDNFTTDNLTLYLVKEEIPLFTVSYYDAGTRIGVAKYSAENYAELTLESLWTADNEKLQEVLGETYSFLGWTTDVELKVPVTDAFKPETFAKGEVKLYLNKELLDLGKVLKYYDVNGNQIGEDYKFATRDELNALTLLDATSELVTSNLPAGYRFVEWIDKTSGNAINLDTFKNNDNIKTLEAKMSISALEYSAKVIYYNGNADASKNVQITYKDGVGFSSYDKTRTYYTFVGFEFGGKVYTKSGNDYVNSSDKLSDAIKAQANLNVEMTAVWTCQYDSLKIGVSGIDTYNEVKVYGKKGDSYVEVTNTSTYYFNTETATNLESGIYGAIFAQYEGLYFREGGAYQAVGSLAQIKVRYNGVAQTEITGAAMNNVSFADIITILSTKVDLSTNGEITLQFVFNK